MPPLRRTLAALCFCALALATAHSQAGTWTIDPNHSAAEFSVRHMMISNVKGAFSKVSGTVQYDPADVSKTVVDATVETASVDTRQEGRDKDLRSANFFDVEKYPTMTFKSKKVEAAGSGHLKMTGDLTIHGTTREVTFDVEGPSPAIKDQQGNLHMGASATARINRKDFGLTYNRLLETGGAVVSDEVQITLDVELKRAAAAPAAASK